MVEFAVIVMIGVALAFLAPRAGLFTGLAAIILGILPVALLFFVPSASRPRIEEQYGMLSTFALLTLTPTGLLMTIISASVLRR